MIVPGEVPAEDVAVVETRLEIAAPDGYRLGAQLFARADLRDPADAVVFNAGGGLSSLRYRHFLRFLARQGMPVLAYDYRGVGISRPINWRGFDAGIEDWCELDQVGAIEAMRARFPAARLSSVSHSIGCMIAAAAPNAPGLHQMVFIAPHTAYWGDYLQPWRWPMAFMWHVLMPATARVVGYFPASRLGLGDDLPRRVALQWASRRTPEYRPGAAGGDPERETVALDRMARLTVPALVISITDDAFAPEIAVRRFLMGLARAPVVRRVVDARVDGATVGHWGYLRRANTRMWELASRFLGAAGTSRQLFGPTREGHTQIESQLHDQ
jgi:predicted alpha/beta hydrolase